MPIGLAFSSFFRLLVGKQLHPDCAEYLPQPVLSLPEAAPVPEPAKPAAAKPATSKPLAQHHKDGALALLALLQREGRLVDFLREGLEGHDDATIGAAARDVHRGCKKVLDDHVSLEPMLPGEDDSPVTVPRGFDPTEIRLIGEARGEPPFQGTLRHHGWRATQTKLPGLTEGVDRNVVAPAEVEIVNR